MRKCIICILVLLVSACCHAVVVMPSVFRNGMVLQQRSEVLVWGKAAPHQKVKVKPSWSKKTYVTSSLADSTWSVRVSTPVASFEHYTMSVTSGETILIDDILIGEVWFAGGQSNMEMPVEGYVNQPVYGTVQTIADSKNDYIRFYTMKHRSALVRQWDCPGRWESASPSTTGHFSATGYYFANQLFSVLQVPVAIIHCSWGGSTIEAWMSPEAMSVTPELKIPATEKENYPKHHKPTGLYKGQLSAVCGFGIRGVIWYQGESNRTKYNTYRIQFPQLCKTWREEWGIGDFPFYFCQLAPYAYPDDRWNCGFMREVQEQMVQIVPNTGMAVLIDVGDSACIHPPYKKEAGERLAYLAMRDTYGFEKFVAEGPYLDAYMVRENKIYLKFRNAPQGVTSYGKPVTGFEIAGADSIFYPGRVTFTRKEFYVESDSVPAPVAVRYCFKDYCKGSVFGTNGLPLAPFRTDDWNNIINNK